MIFPPSWIRWAIHIFIIAEEGLRDGNYYTEQREMNHKAEPYVMKNLMSYQHFHEAHR